MTIEQYIDRLNRQYQTGRAREHSYRGDLQNLLEALAPDVLVTNEPARVACGAPDYILTRKNIPIGYIEAKNIGDTDLQGKKANKEQFNKYKATHDPFIFTDYLDFYLYRDGEFVASIAIATIENGKIIGNPQKYAEFQNLIKEFSAHVGQTIRSAERLSKMMAGKARLMKDVFQNALESDIEDSLNPDTALQQQFAAFKDVLIHDITPKDLQTYMHKPLLMGCLLPACTTLLWRTSAGRRQWSLSRRPIPSCVNSFNTLRLI